MTRPTAPVPDPGAHGLCATCVHVRPVTSARGSLFLMCGRAATDPRYRKYPPLPVLACPGHERGPATSRDP